MVGSDPDQANAYFTPVPVAAVHDEPIHDDVIMLDLDVTRMTGAVRRRAKVHHGGALPQRFERNRISRRPIIVRMKPPMTALMIIRLLSGIVVKNT